MKRLFDEMKDWLGFWIPYLWAKTTHPITGRHRWLIMNITNGNVRVSCRTCLRDREPTPAELRANVHFFATREERARQRALEEAIERALKDQGYTR